MNVFRGINTTLTDKRLMKSIISFEYCELNCTIGKNKSKRNNFKQTERKKNRNK